MHCQIITLSEMYRKDIVVSLLRFPGFETKRLGVCLRHTQLLCATPHFLLFPRSLRRNPHLSRNISRAPGANTIDSERRRVEPQEKMVGAPGLEPGSAELETAVVPLQYTPCAFFRKFTPPRRCVGNEYHRVL